MSVSLSNTADPYQMVLEFRPILDLTDEQFFALCQINTRVRMERTADGEIVIMPPVGAEGGRRNAHVTTQLGLWTLNDGRGIAFDSSAGFTLPNGATRSPDACWVRSERWNSLIDEEKNRFAPLCPEFVVELKSPSDNLRSLQQKMEEWIANGAVLDWLIDPFVRRVYIYRSGASEPEILEAPASVSGEPLLPGFVLQLDRIWNLNI